VKILWIKSGGVLPLDAGGKIRSFKIASELARRHEVTLFTFYPKMSCDPHERLGQPFARVEYLPLEMPERRSASDLLAYTTNSLTSRPYQLQKYCRPQVHRRLKEVLLGRHHDVIICDFLPAAWLVPRNISIPMVIFTHNVEATIWRRNFLMTRNLLWKLVAWRESWAVARAERRLTGQAEHVLTVSDDDRQFFLDFLPAEKVTTVPTGVDLDYFRPRTERRKPTHSLVFTGSMDWIPNEDAVTYFSEKILPRIQKYVPDVTLRIVGRKPTRKVLALKEKNPAIQVTGTVDDIRPFVSDADVYIVPLRIGSGTRIKIFEAMAMGMPVVSTSVGAEGLPVQHEKNILLAETPETFAAHTVALLTQSPTRERISRAARALVESRFGWTTVTDVVDETLQLVAARRRGVS
jgi:sugar transferase (PEP-CTERM/EpsH1 system associated)